MADFGSSFAAAYSAVAGAKRAKEQLELQKEIVTLKSKLLNAQLEQEERRVRATAALKALFLQTQMPQAAIEQAAAGIEGAVEGPESEIGPRLQAASRVPFVPEARVPTRQEVAAHLAELEPKAAAEVALTREPSSLREILSDLRGAGVLGGGGAGPTLPARAAAAAPEGLGAPVEAVTGLGPNPAAASGGGTPALSFKPTINISKTGEVSLTIAGERTSFQMTHQDATLPDGRVQKQEIVFDPTRGAVVNRYPIGAPTSPEFMRKAEALVEGLGYERTSPLFGRVVTQVLAAQALPADAQAEMLASLERVAQQVRATAPRAATAAPVGTIGEALEAAEARQTGREIAREAREEARGVRGTARETAAQTERVREREAIQRQERYLPAFRAVDEMEATLERVKQLLPPPGVLNRLRQSPQLLSQYYSQRNVPLRVFEDARGGFESSLARLVEVGVMTNQDIARFREQIPALVPNPALGRLPDTYAVAREKLSRLRRSLEAIALADIRKLGGPPLPPPTQPTEVIEELRRRGVLR